MPSSARALCELHSFPTRRSSDLGPKQSIPLSRRASATPATSGPSGPTTTRSASSSCASPTTAAGSEASSGSTGTSDAMPTLPGAQRSEEHTSELQSLRHLVCRLLHAPSANYTLSLHDALPISGRSSRFPCRAGHLRHRRPVAPPGRPRRGRPRAPAPAPPPQPDPRHRAGAPARATRCRRCPVRRDRKSTRLNSSHLGISYAVFCTRPLRTTLFPYTTLFRSRAEAVDSLVAQGICDTGDQWPLRADHDEVGLELLRQPHHRSRIRGIEREHRHERRDADVARCAEIGRAHV